MKQQRLLVLGCAATFLAGCASWFPETPEPAEKEPEPLGKRGMDYAVSYVKPHSDIVILEASYRHVILPSGATVSYRPDWDAEQLEQAAEALDREQAGREGEDSAPSSEQESAKNEGDRSNPSQDTPSTESTTASPGSSKTEQAWRKLCEDRLEDMSEGDYFLIQTTRLPESLKDECNERVALARLK